MRARGVNDGPYGQPDLKVCNNENTLGIRGPQGTLNTGGFVLDAAGERGVPYRPDLDVRPFVQDAQDVQRVRTPLKVPYLVQT